MKKLLASLLLLLSSTALAQSPPTNTFGIDFTSNALGVAAAGHARIRYNGGQLQVSLSGGAYTAIGGSSTLRADYTNGASTTDSTLPLDNVRGPLALSFPNGDPTTGTTGLRITNPTPATALADQAAPLLTFDGAHFTGGVSQAQSFQLYAEPAWRGTGPSLIMAQVVGGVTTAVGEWNLFTAGANLGNQTYTQLFSTVGGGLYTVQEIIPGGYGIDFDGDGVRNVGSVVNRAGAIITIETRNQYTTFTAGQTVPVGPALGMRIRYNDGTNTPQVSLNGAAYVDLLTATSGVASVANGDGGTLTVSPNTGAVLVGINLAHNDAWTGLHTWTINNISSASVDQPSSRAITEQNLGALPGVGFQQSPVISFVGSQFSAGEVGGAKTYAFDFQFVANSDGTNPRLALYTANTIGTGAAPGAGTETFSFSSIGNITASGIGGGGSFNVFASTSILSAAFTFGASSLTPPGDASYGLGATNLRWGTIYGVAHNSQASTMTFASTIAASGSAINASMDAPTGYTLGDAILRFTVGGTAVGRVENWAGIGIVWRSLTTGFAIWDSTNLEGFEITAGQIAFQVSGASQAFLTASVFEPNTNNAIALGARTLAWKGLFNSANLSCGENTQANATYTATTLDCIVVMTNSAARTMTLPAASTVNVGTTYYVWDGNGNAGTNNVSVAPNGTDTINGANATTAVVTVNKQKGTCQAISSTAWLCGLNN